MAWEVSQAQRVALARRIEGKMRTKGWTQVKLADAAGYTDRTIRKVLDGEPTNYQTVVDICDALELSLEESAAESNEVAAEEYGAYAKTNFGHYAGRYFGYRRMFAKSRRIMRSCFSMSWSDGRLKFSELQSFNKNCDDVLDHTGSVYISAHTGLIHLVTTWQGAVRLVTLTKLQNGSMRGVVLTQSERTLYYQPSVSALLLERIHDPVDERSFDGKAGPLDSADPEYERVNRELRETEADVIFIAQAQDA